MPVILGQKYLLRGWSGFQSEFHSNPNVKFPRKFILKYPPPPPPLPPKSKVNLSKHRKMKRQRTIAIRSKRLRLIADHFRNWRRHLVSRKKRDNRGENNCKFAWFLTWIEVNLQACSTAHFRRLLRRGTRKTLWGGRLCAKKVSVLYLKEVVKDCVTCLYNFHRIM